MSEKKQALKSSAHLGLLTLISRILGLVRDASWAFVLGVNIFFDAFVIAFTIPNLFRALLGEGALNGAFVPVFTDEMTHNGKKEAFKIANLIITALSLILTLLTLIVILILFILGKFYADNERILLIINLTKIMIPYVGFVCLVGLMMGISNSLKQFFIPGFSPILLNLILIGALFTICPLFGDTPRQKVFGMAVAVLLAGIAQFLLQFFTLKKYEFKLHFNLNLKHPAVKKIFYLVLPAILGLSINQINVVVDRCLCYIIGEGAASYLYYSTRLIYLPLGIFSVSLATVNLPLMSRYNATKEFEKSKDVLIDSLRIIFFITLPATFGLIVLGKPIIKLLFQRGAFSAYYTDETFFTLIFYSLGLFAICSVKLVVTTFHSLKETKTPVRIGLAALVINIIFNLILMGPLRQGGLALATSISALFNFLLLLKMLEKKLGKINYYSLFQAFLYSLGFSLIMGGVCFFVKNTLMQFFLNDNFLTRLIMVFVPLLFGIATIIALAAIFQIKEFKEIAIIIKTKLKKQKF